MVSTPARICGTCGEWLPHYCAGVTEITWSADGERRFVAITDRAPSSSVPLEVRAA